MAKYFSFWDSMLSIAANLIRFSQNKLTSLHWLVGYFKMTKKLSIFVSPSLWHMGDGHWLFILVAQWTTKLWKIKIRGPKKIVYMIPHSPLYNLNLSTRGWARNFFQTCTQWFLTIKNFQINAIVASTYLVFIPFWSKVSSITLHIVI